MNGDSNATSHQEYWRIAVRKFSRTALLFALALFSNESAALFVPNASAAAIPPAAQQTTKKPKRRNRKKKILKGRHGKHTRRPA